MELHIPEHLKEKTYFFPESSYGANRVTLFLKNKRKIKHVFLAWGNQIVKIDRKMINDESDLDFEVSEIIDVISEI